MEISNKRAVLYKFSPENSLQRTRPDLRGIRSISILEPVRVLLVEPQQLFLRGVHLALEECTEFELVGETSTGQEALIKAGKLLPDVILCSIELPDMEGLDLCRSIRRRLPQISIILLTDNEEDAQLFSALRAGAAAYSDRNMSAVSLLNLVRQVGRGHYLINEQVFLKPLIAKQVLQKLNKLHDSEHTELIEDVFLPLTSREHAVLVSIANGNSNKKIAMELLISCQTVKNHITHILRKLHANDRTQAVITAIKNGWINF